ncbi:MAG: glycosyltransferase family 4 protein [Desulfurobacteriaceae bacterium]
MKILQATTAIGWSGGTEQCFLLAKYMNQLGYKTDILTYKGCELHKRAKKEGINTVFFPTTNKLSISGARKLARIIENYDIVNTHISKAHWFVWLASFFARPKPKLVYTRRVLFNISPISSLTKYNINVDALIGISNEICKKLRKFPFLRKKVYYIPSGVELERFNPSSTFSIKEKLGLPLNSLVITHVANFSKVKGQEILIRAFKKLLETIKDKEIFLLLVGRDTQGEEAKTLVKRYGLENRVFLLGFRRDIPQILKSTDLFVFPSINEGLGSSLLQAMAMEKIVVASYVGGIKTYLKHMENGIAVEPGSVESLHQGLLKGLENLNNEKMKENARKTAEEFDIKRITEKTLQLYEELLR